MIYRSPVISTRYPRRRPVRVPGHPRSTHQRHQTRRDGASSGHGPVFDRRCGVAGLRRGERNCHRPKLVTSSGMIGVPNHAPPPIPGPNHRPTWVPNHASPPIPGPSRQPTAHPNHQPKTPNHQPTKPNHQSRQVLYLQPTTSREVAEFVGLTRLPLLVWVSKCPREGCVRGQSAVHGGAGGRQAVDGCASTTQNGV